MEPTTDQETISVMIVDDHAIWRGGVRSMLEDTEFEVVVEAGSGTEAVALARTHKPRIALLDVRMAGGDGLEALKVLKEEHPQMCVVMLTTYDNVTFMARAVAGGASGYLLKGIDVDELLKTLRAVANGEQLLHAEDLKRTLRTIDRESANQQDLIQPLTEREVEVLRLLSVGLTNREIGSVLFIAESTVKSHVEHIIAKLGVSDRVQAAVWAARHGIVVSEHK